jgi:hypothetical protein
VLSLKPRDWLVISGLLGASALLTLLAWLLMPTYCWIVAFMAGLGSLLLLQLDTYRRLQGTLIEFHDRPGQNYRQTEALFSLFALLPIKAALPPLRGAAISPDFAAHLASLILRERPETVLELGSGSSTIISGCALRAAGRGRVMSLEENEEYARETRRHLADHRLEDIATVVHAPLTPAQLPAGEVIWYDRRALPLQNTIDLLVVDGPLQTGRPGEAIRYPALPLLAERLSKECVILVDDCDRAQEKSMVERWLREFPDFAAEPTRGEKQHVVLRRTQSHGSRQHDR